MDTSSSNCQDKLESIFRSWSSIPEACLLNVASLHVKESNFWNPTLGKKPWILSDYLEFNHIFTQLEMLLKEKVRCILGLNPGIQDLQEVLSIQTELINELVQELTVSNDPMKEARLRSMWLDMEEFANRGLEISKRTFEIKETQKDVAKSTKLKPNLNAITMKEEGKETNMEQKEILEIQPQLLKPLKDLPLYWKKSQPRLLKLQEKMQNFLKFASFKFLRNLTKDKNKIIINLFDSQNLSGKIDKNYNIFNPIRINQSMRILLLIKGLINYKYKRRRKMSEDAKDDKFINVFDNIKVHEENLDDKEKENRRLSMINKLDMALKYNNVLRVKQLMNDDDFGLLSEEDTKSINLKARLAAQELYEIKQLMEKEEMNKLKLSWDKEKGKGTKLIDEANKSK